MVWQHVHLTLLLVLKGFPKNGEVCGINLSCFNLVAAVLHLVYKLNGVYCIYYLSWFQTLMYKIKIIDTESYCKSGI